MDENNQVLFLCVHELSGNEQAELKRRRTASSEIFGIFFAIHKSMNKDKHSIQWTKRSKKKRVQ